MRTVSCLYDSLGTYGTCYSSVSNICKRTLDCSGIIKCEILDKTSVNILDLYLFLSPIHVWDLNFTLSSGILVLQMQKLCSFLTQQYELENSCLCNLPHNSALIIQVWWYRHAYMIQSLDFVIKTEKNTLSLWDLFLFSISFPSERHTGAFLNCLWMRITVIRHSSCFEVSWSTKIKHKTYPQVSSTFCL